MGFQLYGLAGEEGGKVFGQHKWSESIDLEGRERIVVFDLLRAFLWMENAGNAKGKTEVVHRGGEKLGALGCCVGDCIFICVARRLINWRTE